MTAPTRPQLTDREIDVLERMAAGSTYDEIARDYGLSNRTLCWIGQCVMRKLGARSIAQAVLLACRAGLLDGRPLLRHGDHAGYEAHRRRRIPYCDACIEGEKAYRAALKAAKAAQRPSEGLGEPRPSRTASAPPEAATGERSGPRGPFPPRQRGHAPA